MALQSYICVVLGFSPSCPLWLSCGVFLPATACPWSLQHTNAQRITVTSLPVCSGQRQRTARYLKQVRMFDVNPSSGPAHPESSAVTSAALLQEDTSLSHGGPTHEPSPEQLNLQHQPGHGCWWWDAPPHETNLHLNGPVHYPQWNHLWVSTDTRTPLLLLPAL